MYHFCAFIGLIVLTFIAVAILASIAFYIFIVHQDKKEQEEINKIKSNILNGKE